MIFKMEDYKIIKQKTGEFILNLEPSKIDKRDWVAEAIYPDDVKIPKELDLRPFLQPVQHQGSQGTCSAQVAACMKEYQEYKDKGLTGEENKMSPQFIYNLREDIGTSGMTPRETMKIIAKQGVCREFIFPYGDLEYPPEDAFKDAENFRIQNYAQVNTIEGLKKALVKNGVCYICYPVFNETGRFWKARQGDEELGGHAVAVVGYNKNGFIIRNSWGKDWEDNGYTYYPYEDWGAHWEVWTTIDRESVLPDFNAEDYKRPISAKGLLLAGAGILMLFGLLSDE